MEEMLGQIQTLDTTRGERKIKAGIKDKGGEAAERMGRVAIGQTNRCAEDVELRSVCW